MARIIQRSKIGLVGEGLTEAIKAITAPGGAIVTPTKVGYIIMTTDKGGLDKKFDLKKRPKRKPGVVLCSSLEQLEELAEMNDKTKQLYQTCWDDDVLLGCILPWKKDAMEKYVPKDGSKEMISDARETSCFVIQYGKPSQVIADKLWFDSQTLCFASSANPSGQGNRGQLEGVGERILEGVDLAIEADDFVKAQQPNANSESRHEQGVMVSMVDDDGNMLDIPVLIRRGLAVEIIVSKLADVFGEYDYRHGSYY